MARLLDRRLPGDRRLTTPGPGRSRRRGPREDRLAAAPPVGPPPPSCRSHPIPEGTRWVVGGGAPSQLDVELRCDVAPYQSRNAANSAFAVASSGDHSSSRRRSPPASRHHAACTPPATATAHPIAPAGFGRRRRFASAVAWSGRRRQKNTLSNSGRTNLDRGSPKCPGTSNTSRPSSLLTSTPGRLRSGGSQMRQPRPRHRVRRRGRTKRRGDTSEGDRSGPPQDRPAAGAQERAPRARVASAGGSRSSGRQPGRPGTACAPRTQGRPAWRHGSGRPGARASPLDRVPRPTLARAQRRLRPGTPLERALCAAGTGEPCAAAQGGAPAARSDTASPSPDARRRASDSP